MVSKKPLLPLIKDSVRKRLPRKLPHQIEAYRYFDTALRLHQRDEINSAILFYKKSIDLDPECSEVLNNLAIALSQQGKIDTAIAALKMALLKSPDDPILYANLGNYQWISFQFEEAEHNLKKAIKLDPESPDIWYRIGVLYNSIGRIHEAIEAYENGLATDPDNIDLNFDVALALLTAGDYERGFKAYEHRWTKIPVNPISKRDIPRWNGEDLTGKIIAVTGEQGFGDSLMCSRFLPMVKARGAKMVIFAPPQELKSIFEGYLGIDLLPAIDETIPDPDYYISLFTLPLVFGTTLETIPKPVPFLAANVNTGISPIPKPEGTKLSVGITWTGRPTHHNDLNRSIPLTNFLTLVDIPGIKLYSLQVGRNGDLYETGADCLIEDLQGRLNDFVCTAEVLRQLDVLVSCDTAIVHLAGTLGMPTFVLLPLNSDWRWGRNSETTVWYENMRLIRQTKPQFWGDVFVHVREMLVDLVKQKES